MLKINSNNELYSTSIRPGNVFTIASGGDFLNILVDQILNGKIFSDFTPIANPQLLSTLTIYVPNRRAARALTSTLLDASKNKATFLPKIRVLGDVEDDEFDLETSLEIANALPQSINPLERKIELAKLVQAWVGAMSDDMREYFGDEDIAIPSSQADALYLADDLCILLGQITQEEIDWKTIQNIVPDDHAEWWRLTTTFLKIIMEHWPTYLRQKGYVDPAERMALKLKLRAKIFEEKGSDGPVIVAGSTGSVRSTQSLLKAISNLPNGAVVLPGLDLAMPDHEWNALGKSDVTSPANLETHPQYGLAQLLNALQTTRENVTELANLESDTAKRQWIVGTALSTAPATGQWFDISQNMPAENIDGALSNIAYINAQNERQEASAIAVAMREVLNEENKTVALVTPDRNLASRVTMELRRFGIDVDDTGGTPLRNAAPSLFLRQIAKLGFDETPGNLAITTLLKNTLSVVGYEPHESTHVAQLFELVALRGAIHSPKLGEFETFLTARRKTLETSHYISSHVRNMDEDDWLALKEFTERIDGILAPLAAMSTRANELPLSEIIEILFSVAQKLSANPEGNSTLFEQEGGEELKRLYDDITSTEAGTLCVNLFEFPAIFDALLARGTVRPRFAKNPRLHIYGPLEVRLLSHDRVILAGLNEGTWPQLSGNDPFLNRVMRQELFMASPERRIGLAAHDFQQLMGAREVILSRSSRVDKAPTVASRWLQRFFALVGKGQFEKLESRGKTYLDLAHILDDAEPTPRVKRPCPTPPIGARPITLPVTAIETWIRDPYALYAERILKLKPLEPLEREPDALLKGTLYHAIMQTYVEHVPIQLSEEERFSKLLTIATEFIKAETLPPEIEKVWLYRFSEITTRYIAWESRYHTDHSVVKTHCEIKGSILIGDDFTLTARADRIDVFDDGQINVLDYKTGSNPTPKQARLLSPQLALEGLIAQRAGFTDIAQTDLFDLIYMRLMPGDKFNPQRIADKNNTISSIIENAVEELTKLVEVFKVQEQGYISRRAPFLESEMSNDYDHLARTREWSFGEEGDSDE